MMKKPIKQYNLQELASLVSSFGQAPFRTKQLLEWVYGHHIESYDEISNLPAKLLNPLKENNPLYTPTVSDKQVSHDGTRKYLLKMYDGGLIETVAIPSTSGKERLTVCFSTQVGCPMKCTFCATGHEGFSRNLGMGEIIDQIHIVEKDFGHRVTNLVGMGQGEPFLNTDNVLDALELLNNKKMGNIGARHITISTCGIPQGIDRFAEDPHQYTLAVSLHSAIQSTRDEIMPVVAKYPLESLHARIESYLQKTNRRVTFEYLLIKDINDTQDHLNALASYCQDLLCHVNLLPMNEVKASPFKPTSKKTLSYWTNYLMERGIETSIRNSRGSDIDGACGQLKNTFSTK